MKKVDVDAKDIEILNVLSENASITNKDLAERVGLTAGPTLVRVQNLIKRKLILKYIIEANLRLFGYTEYCSVEIITNGNEGDFTEELKKHNCVLEILKLNEALLGKGSVYRVRLLAKTEAQLFELAAELFENKDYVISAKLHIVKEVLKRRPFIFSEEDKGNIEVD